MTKRKTSERTIHFNSGNYDYLAHLTPTQKENAEATFTLREDSINIIRRAINRKAHSHLTWNEVCECLNYQGMNKNFTFPQAVHFLSTAFKHPPDVQQRFKDGVACAWEGKDILHLAQNENSAIHLWFEVRTDHSDPTNQLLLW